MVTTKQKPIDAQKTKKKSKHTIIKNITSQRGQEKEQDSQKTIMKKAVSIYLAIITLNVNGLSFSKDSG